MYKTGVSNSLDGNHFKTPRRNIKDKKETANEQCSDTINEVSELYTNNNHDTCGECGIDVQVSKQSTNSWVLNKPLLI